MHNGNSLFNHCSTVQNARCVTSKDIFFTTNTHSAEVGNSFAATWIPEERILRQSTAITIYHLHYKTDKRCYLIWLNITVLCVVDQATYQPHCFYSHTTPVACGTATLNRVSHTALVLHVKRRCT